MRKPKLYTTLRIEDEIGELFKDEAWESGMTQTQFMKHVLDLWKMEKLAADATTETPLVRMLKEMQSILEQKEEEYRKTHQYNY